jgi:hypothetical protein
MESANHGEKHWEHATVTSAFLTPVEYHFKALPINTTSTAANLKVELAILILSALDDLHCCACKDLGFRSGRKHHKDRRKQRRKHSHDANPPADILNDV